MARYKVLKPSGDLIALDSPMVGATDMVSGVGGIVPAPQIGDQNKVLMGNGQYENVVQGIKGDAETDYKTGTVNLTYANIGTAAQGRVALGLGDANGALPITLAQGGTGLTASPSMLTNLGSTSAADVLQASPRPGVTGTLKIANGGTGLTASPSMLTNLGSTSADNVLKASPRPGITGTLGIANGGTGVTNFKDLFKVETHSFTKDFVAGNGSMTEIVRKSGWYAIAIVGIQYSSESNVVIREFFNTGGSSSVISFKYRNLGSAISMSVIFHVLWCKTTE